MISISKLAKSLIAIIIVGAVLTFSSCSKSDQEKASILIKEHAKTTIADYESFEIVQIDTLKEVFSDVYEEQVLSDLYSVYHYYLDSIENMNKTILDLNYYIDENIPILEDLARRTDAAGWRSLTTFTQSNVNNHLSARNDYQSLYDRAKRLANEMDRADAMRKSLQRDVYNCNDSLSVFRKRTIAFYNNYKPKYLGRGTVVKCRFRGDNSNMMLVSYKAIFNDEISELLSIEEVVSGNKQDIKTFVDGIVNENNLYEDEDYYMEEGDGNA